ncbi:hypothetical protein LJC58_07785 [Lachnospiraceae bacterium OttesenSCG-928-D06]|nr:hypothetical protein [Lachnospiraceae bacterium OttesenSCG-928-D06]
MDTFMDKLAQKLTAQDMIKANSAAEAEEMNKLQNQIKEYHQCLEQMNKVSGRMSHLNEEMTQIKEEINTLLTETMKDDKDSAELIALLTKQLEESNNNVEVLLNDKFQAADEKLYTLLNEKLNASDQDLETLLEEKLESKLNEKIESINIGTASLLNEKFQASDEYVHRENVKVYRNVQAVVVEESNKQLSSLRTEMESVKKKNGIIFTFSILAMLFSGMGILFQILLYLRVL